MLHKELSIEDPSSFQNYIRMEQLVLEELLHAVAPLIEKKDTVMRQAIPAQDRLSVTLRYLATGNSFMNLSYSVRIALNTLSQIIPNTLKAIVEVLEKKVFNCPSSPVEWQVLAEKFNIQWQFPHCLGSLDGKRINFRPPRKAGSVYRNYKGKDSIIFLALVDADYNFIFVDVGRNGRMHDASVFRESSLATQLHSGTLNLSLPSSLPGYNVDMPYVIVADDAFPLKTNIMKPYPGRNLTNEKKIFNYRLSKARRTVENAFGIMANRFRILLNTIPLSVEKVELITYTCCILHNFLLQKKAHSYISLELRNNISESIQSNLNSILHQNGNRCTDRAVYY
ncbi:protein ALP1-like [Monomorium pharaonis]|uniref:protein ALP1-like n=1 Tax=Monomorium pharaonis TaxID=307658 RepID=UPI0017461C48|nr:protein ALP1-like [Monomorium pharaonis]XP_036150710.1 protein ALP1-like [Monomorium pharaonis]